MAILSNSCDLGQKEPEKPRTTANVRLAGVVHSVNKQGNFVLIRRYGSWRVDEGQVVESRGSDGRTASLKPTGEKLGEHVAADILSGSVEAGDAVYVRRIISKKQLKSEKNEEEKPNAEPQE